MNTFRISLDLDKALSLEHVRIRQGDEDGTKVVATIFSHGAAADLSGVDAAHLVVNLGRGNYYRAAATVDGSTVTHVIDESAAQFPACANCEAYFTLTSGTDVYSTSNFTVAVLRDATEDATLSPEYDSAIQDAIDAIPGLVLDELAEQGVEVVLTVTDGDLSITLNTPE